jgi:hypothetical protein
VKKAIQPVFLVCSAAIVLWICGCAPVPTPLASTPAQAAPPASEQVPDTDPPLIAEVEKQAGFEVQAPGYLPAGVSLESAAFESETSAGVVLRFKLVHEQYGDMGPFFQIRQEPLTEPPPAVPSCGDGAQGCEILQADARQFVYYLYPSPSGDGADTESFEWYADGFFFMLHRMAGEPGKIYKDELLKVASSME